MVLAVERKEEAEVAVGVPAMGLEAEMEARAMGLEVAMEVLATAAQETK